MKSIVFASGKGGVGKSTIALNLGLFLAKAGKSVVVVDADLEMANIGIFLGIDVTPITLHNVLSGENKIQDAVYEGPQGLKYVPAGLSPDKLGKVDFKAFPEAIKPLGEGFDYVLVDCPPGLGQDAKAAIKASKECIIVVTPDPASLADALKVKRVSEQSGCKVTGLVLNMVTGDKTEIQKKDFETVMELSVFAVLPEDKEVRRSTALQQPVALRAPTTAFCRALRLLANKLTGETLVVKEEPKPRKGLLQSLKELFSRIFGRKG